MNAFSRFRAVPAASALGLLAALPFWVSPASAEPSAADRESARALMKEGDAAVAAKNWTTARRAFAEAHRLMKLPSTGRELARAEEGLGHFLEAKDVCETVARTPQIPGEPAPFETARKECVEVAAALDKRIATVRLTVQGPGADSVKITLDGATFPGPNALRRANPGDHEVSALATTGATAKQTVKLVDGETKDITLTLVPVAPVATAPPTATAPPPLVEPAPTAPPIAPPPPAPPPESHTTAYVLLGVGGAALVTGGVFGALALSDYGKANDACPTHKGCSPDVIDRRDSAGTKAWVANGGVGLGVLLGAVGTYLLVSGPSPSSTAAHTPAPSRSRFFNPSVMFTRSGASASLGGTF
jgi:hypothetical protein